MKLFVSKDIREALEYSGLPVDAEWINHDSVVKASRRMLKKTGDEKYRIRNLIRHSRPMIDPKPPKQLPAEYHRLMESYRIKQENDEYKEMTNDYSKKPE